MTLYSALRYNNNKQPCFGFKGVKIVKLGGVKISIPLFLYGSYKFAAKEPPSIAIEFAIVESYKLGINVKCVRITARPHGRTLDQRDFFLKLYMK